MSRLFSQLATQFSHSPEDLATEGLCYLLRHRTAEEAFIEYVNAQSDTSLPSSLTFQTQEDAEEGKGKPDLRGMDGDGQIPLLVESKFWAGLTENQPGGYLEALADVSGSVLLFLVPHPRREYLWPKISDRTASSFVVQDEQDSESSLSLRLANGTVLLLRSWREVLNSLETVIQAEGGQRELLEDLHQIQSLCERYSREGFLPLRGDEIGQDVGRRVQQLCRIVLDVDPRLDDDAFAQRNMSTSRHRYGLRTHLHGIKAIIAINYYWWAEDGRSPIWLRIKAGTNNRQEAVRTTLRPDFHAFNDYPSSYPTDVLVPLPPKLGVEQEDIVDDLASQLNTVAARLAPVLKDEA